MSLGKEKSAGFTCAQRLVQHMFMLRGVDLTQGLLNSGFPGHQFERVLQGGDGLLPLPGDDLPLAFLQGAADDLI